MGLPMKHMLFFGFGFSARTLALQLNPREWKVTATSRSAEGVSAIAALGYHGLMFDAAHDVPKDVTHIVSSAPPDADGDPVLRRYGPVIAASPTLDWIAYLSTTGVYGDHGGAWVDENTALTPNTERGHRRLSAEADWLALFENHAAPVHVFRLAGIYGVGRNALESLKDGKAKRVIREGQIFSRIHVEDIA
jgi:nucleoside-diphosphate-sugar epimerase